MTAPADGQTARPERASSSSAAHRRRSQAAKVPFWKRDLGRKSPDHDDVEHPVFQPTLPRVNLLPPSVAERYAARRVRRWLIAIGCFMLLAFAGAWNLQANQVAQAQADLDRALADNAVVTAKVADLAPIKQMYAQITGEKELVATTLAAQPRSALVIERLLAAGRAAQGDGGPVDFTSIAANYRGIPAPGGELNPCPTADPFAQDITVGCITFSGTAATRAQVSALLTVLTADSLFVGPFVNNSTVAETTSESAGTVMFTGTVGVGTLALEQPLSLDEVEAILTPPVPQDAAADQTQEP
jgi:Tfp pilus assembly protein PilN